MRGWGDLVAPAPDICVTVSGPDSAMWSFANSLVLMTIRVIVFFDEFFNHGVVHHSAGEYVIGAIYTKTIDGFWSMIKRGIVGTFHKVSKKYLQLYVAEFEFRYNNRKNPDIFGAAIELC